MSRSRIARDRGLSHSSSSASLSTSSPTEHSEDGHVRRVTFEQECGTQLTIFSFALIQETKFALSEGLAKKPYNFGKGNGGSSSLTHGSMGPPPAPSSSSRLSSMSVPSLTYVWLRSSGMLTRDLDPSETRAPIRRTTTTPRSRFSARTSRIRRTMRTRKRQRGSSRRRRPIACPSPPSRRRRPRHSRVKVRVEGRARFRAAVRRRQRGQRSCGSVGIVLSLAGPVTANILALSERCRDLWSIECE